jgi:hypothetical protein
MRGILMVAMAAAMLAAPAVRAEGARPENPSGFGQTAKAEAALGLINELAVSSAHNGDRPGASAEVQMFRAMNDSLPNPSTGKQ